MFHHNIAKLLFICNRAWQVLQTQVTFLTTRVKEHNEDDCINYKQVWKYLNGTKELCLALKAKGIRIIKWYVDASYAIHDDCHGHSGAMMRLGQGEVTDFSRKQKLNAKSSTNAEIIGVVNSLPQILWT